MSLASSSLASKQSSERVYLRRLELMMQNPKSSKFVWVSVAVLLAGWLIWALVYLRLARQIQQQYTDNKILFKVCSQMVELDELFKSS